MAGGSADAAAALVALDRLWELAHLRRRPARAGGPSSGATCRSRWSAVRRSAPAAASWSSRCPTRRPGGGSRCRRRGGCPRRRSTGASTSSTPTRPAEPRGARAVLLALATGDPEILAGALHNDLETAALDLRPDLGDLLELGERSGALRGLVSGSGPTCLFLTEDADAAREVAGRLSEHHDVVLVTNGPVAGAHVVTYA